MTDSAATPSASSAAPAAPARKLSLAERAKLAIDSELSQRASAAAASDGLTPAQRAIQRQRHALRWARRIVYVVSLVLLLYLFSRFNVYRVPADYASMQPDLAANSTVVLDQWCAIVPGSVGDYAPGSIILFEFAAADGKRRQRFARIIAKPGQTVGIEWDQPTARWHYTVDDELLDHPWPPHAADKSLPPEVPGLVPPGQFFVLEDTTDNTVPTLDSRDFGFLAFEYVRGRLAIQWSNASDAARPK